MEGPYGWKLDSVIKYFTNPDCSREAVSTRSETDREFRGEKYIGVDFGKPIEVKCVSVPLGVSTMTYLRLEGWYGDLGTGAENMGFQPEAHLENLRPLFRTERGTAPPQQARISNLVIPKLQWSVREVEWFEDINCSEEKKVARYKSAKLFFTNTGAYTTITAHVTRTVGFCDKNCRRCTSHGPRAGEMSTWQGVRRQSETVLIFVY